MKLRIAILLAIVVPALGLSSTPPTRAAVTANGCNVDPAKPDNQDGKIIAKVSVECTQALAGREIVVELWQRDSDDVWKPVQNSGISWQGSDQVLSRRIADTDGLDCRNLDPGRTRRYKSLVKVSDGLGRFTEIFSNDEELGRDCLGELRWSSSGDEVDCTTEVCATASYRHKIILGCDAFAHTPTKDVQAGKIKGLGVVTCFETRADRRASIRLCEDNERWFLRACAEGFGYWIGDFASLVLPRNCNATTDPDSMSPGFRGTYSRVVIRVPGDEDRVNSRQFVDGTWHCPSIVG